MKIERRSYSRGAWRLIDANGREVYWQKPFEHPDLGWTFVTMPICGDTKKACTDEALAFLHQCVLRINKGGDWPLISAKIGGATNAKSEQSEQRRVCTA